MSDETMAVTLAYPLTVDGVEIPADETVTLPWQQGHDLIRAGRARTPDVATAAPSRGKKG